MPAGLVLGVGLVFTVAPLTAAVLGAVDDHHAGIGSAINNAIARLGSLLAVAVLPALAGLAAPDGSLSLTNGFGRAMAITAALAAVGGLVAWATVRTVEPTTVVVHGPIGASCLDPCLRENLDAGSDAA